MNHVVLLILYTVQDEALVLDHTSNPAAVGTYTAVFNLLSARPVGYPSLAVATGRRMDALRSWRYCA